MTFKELEASNWIQKGAYAYNVGDQFKNYVYKRSEEAFGKGDEKRDSIKSCEDLEIYRSNMRIKFIEAMGGLPESDNPLNLRTTGFVKGDGFTIEKVIYESRPDTYITSNLYLPDGLTSSRGAVIFVCGHSDDAKHDYNYQAICQYLAQAGLIVLAQDPIGQGERFSYYEKSLGRKTVDSGTDEHSYAGIMCLPLGHGIARYFVHDIMRSIDYLLTRPEVDGSKIGITGNSGGGIQTALAMVCEPRLAAAAPANFIMNRRTYMYSGQGQDGEGVWPGVSAFGFDHEDIILMMAPKPVLILAAKFDFFPIEGTRTTFERVKRFWKLYGSEGSVELFEDDAPHEYNRIMAIKAAEFFSLHFTGRSAVINEEIIKPFHPELLFCTEYGQIRTEMRDTRAVYEENCDYIKILERHRMSFDNEERHQRSINWLKEKVLNRKKVDLNPRHLFKGWIDELLVSGSLWWSHEGIFNHWLMFRDYRYQGIKIPVSIALWNNGTSDLTCHADWIRDTCNAGRTVVVLDLTATGIVSSDENNTKSPAYIYGKLYKLACDLIWLDDSLASMRVYDVTRALDLLEVCNEVDCGDIRLYLCGRYGVYGQLASLIDKRIKYTDLVGGIESYKKLVGSRYYDIYEVINIIFPAILEYFDLPDIDTWRMEGKKSTVPK